MAAAPSSSSSSSSFISLLLFLLIFAASSICCVAKPRCPPPIVDGLSYTFYNSKCPDLEFIVRSYLWQAIANDIGLAAGLLRLHFHDCFVQGCDASVLLDGSASGPSEQNAPPNLTLRPSAFKAINDLRSLIDQACGPVVSCADVVALAARDSVALSGGPDYMVPLGRRDSLTFATRNATLAGLPSPFSNVTTLLSVFNRINLDTTDLVALSGGHTIGLAHCTSFTNRLYPTQDAMMDSTFGNYLRQTCPADNSNNTAVNDIRSPIRFDNMYYVNLMYRQGLFTSDQDLYSDSRTSSIVTSFAMDQGWFFDNFVNSMIKMGQVGVLTGNQGEIRANCSAINAPKNSLWSIIQEAGETTAAF